jgi:hypothetical protein
MVIWSPVRVPRLSTLPGQQKHLYIGFRSPAGSRRDQHCPSSGGVTRCGARTVRCNFHAKVRAMIKVIFLNGPKYRRIRFGRAIYGRVFGA